MTPRQQMISIVVIMGVTLATSYAVFVVLAGPPYTPKVFSQDKQLLHDYLQRVNNKTQLAIEANPCIHF